LDEGLAASHFITEVTQSPFFVILNEVKYLKLTQNHSLEILRFAQNGYKGQKELVFHFGFKKKYHLK
jgi:hypothetical protein